MKIAILSPQDEFAQRLQQELEAKSTDQFIAWKRGEPAPARDIEALIVMGALTGDEMKQQTKLKFIQASSAGYDSIDVDAAAQQGIWVSYAPSEITGNATSVAEFVVLLLLGASRRLRLALDFAQNRSAKKPELNVALKGKTVCIIGLGGVGNQVADRLRPFGMTLTAVDQEPEKAAGDIKAYPPEQLKEALGHADHVVICLRASKENENLFNAETLAAMKKGSVLVNIARGTLVDEDALRQAVSQGHLFAAGLDVEKHEPIEPSDPLLAVPEILVTPHVAWSTELMLEGTVTYIAKVLADYAGGKLPDSLANEPKQPRDGLTAPKKG